MPPSLRDFKNNGFGVLLFGPQALSLTPTLTPLAGDLLFLTIQYFNSNAFNVAAKGEPTTRTVSDNVGNIWTEIAHTFNPDGNGSADVGEGMSLWCCVNAAASLPTVTVTLDRAGTPLHDQFAMGFWYSDITGVVLTSPIVDNTSTGFTDLSSTDTPTIPSFSTTATDFIYATFSLFSHSGDTVNATPGAGYTMSIPLGTSNAFNAEYGDEWADGVGAGSQAPLLNADTVSNHWMYIAAAFKSSVVPTYEISGNVSGPGGPGAMLTLSGDSSATTTADGSGNYSFSGLANGNYVVTPSLSPYAYAPTFRNVTISNASVANVDFTSLSTSAYQTWVYEFDTKTWFQLQRGFSSIAVFEITPGNKIMVGGGTDGLIYVIDDLTGTYTNTAANPASLWRTALMDFGDPDHKHVLTYLELELTNNALAADLTVHFYLDPVDADDPTASVPQRTLTMRQVPGANLYRGFFTGDGGGSLCQRALIEVLFASSTNAGGFRGVKLVADVASSLAGSPLGGL